ncbi:MAG: holo-ACP synthase [Hungatella sp.]|nr:holo-ACP synthase [Hungatella sp.]
MIVGIGTDLVEIARVEKACEKQAFLSRIYTQEERRQAGERALKLSGDFAVKEAVAKALGTGFRKFMPVDIEVLRDELGKPYVILHGEARRLSKELGVTQIHVSISNEKEYALAYVVAEGM